MSKYFEFIETSIFTKLFFDIGTDEDLKNLQVELIQQPEKGDLITNTGGLRKIRVAVSGKGKRGGGRVIYLYLKIKEKIHFCFIYKKGKLDNLTEQNKKELRYMVQMIKKEVS